MPGRITPPMPDSVSPQWAISALTSVPVWWPAAGCTTRPVGLVDDDDLVVLMQDRQRNRLAFGFGRLGRRHRDGEHFARFHLVAGIVDRAAARGDGAIQDQRLQPGARQFGEPRRQHAVEPGAGVVGR